ncbi:hypothetical protein [Microvirga roseola]|uniref:hypothetical protein n=1 Tax=Microvirga roseola TaxID=2883126 RepID=UPI001E5D5E5F|nr:hypothetical protein [Microvirga roseola]
MQLASWPCAVLAAAFIAAPIASPAQGQTARFDGSWSVEVVTEQGACDRAYRYNVVVQNGRLRYGGAESFNVSGQVRPNGAVAATISRGQDRAVVRGNLSGNFGRGTWATSGGRTCSGYWDAERRSR